MKTAPVVQGPSLAHWAGTWSRHGAVITLDAGGNGTMVFRTYRWCYQDAPPCDSTNGNEIVSGGYATFHLSTVSTEQAVAGGYMDSTNEPVPLQPVAVADEQSDPTDDGAVQTPWTITVTGLDASPTTYCNVDAPAYVTSQCG